MRKVSSGEAQTLNFNSSNRYSSRKMAKFALPLFALLLWFFPRPNPAEGQWQPAAAEQKAFNSYPLDNIYTPSAVSDLFNIKPKVPDPYEVNPLFRNQQASSDLPAEPEQALTEDTSGRNGSRLVGKMGEYYKKPTEKPEKEEESEESEEDGEDKEDEDDDDESEGGGVKGGQETSQEAAGGGGGAGGGGAGGEGGGAGGAGGAAPGAPKDSDKDTKNSGLDQINLIGSDFQPGRLVNIFFGIILLMFMMIAQGYMMWVFGIAFLPGTRALNDWKLNTDALDTAMNLLIDAFEYWNDAKLKEEDISRRRR